MVVVYVFDYVIECVDIVRGDYGDGYGIGDGMG